MLKSRRSLRAAACAPFAAALLAGTALAQDNSTVGPPQLKDFQLPGTRTTPPAPIPAPAPVQTAPARTSPPRTAPADAASFAPRREATARTPAQTPPSRRATPAPAPVAAAPSAQPIMRAPAPTPSQTAPAPTPLPPVVAQPQVQPTPPPQSAPPAEAPVAPTGGGFSWLWLLLLLPVAAALGAFAWLRGRRRDAERDVQDRSSLGASLAAARWIDDEPAAPPVAAAEPVVPAPEAPPTPEPEGRAWLELEIKPDRAAATDTEAALHFELTLSNTGPLPARNIRIDSRLFNAADEAEVAAFLAGPIHDKSGSPHISIPPEDSLSLGAAVALRREEVREIQIQGRSIFVPALAINVAYDWDGGTVSGRTSRSWVIGRETEGSPKMGPFRLDLGPRVYRQVGGREAQKVMA